MYVAVKALELPSSRNISEHEVEKDKIKDFFYFVIARSFKTTKQSRY